MTKKTSKRTSKRASKRASKRQSGNRKKYSQLETPVLTNTYCKNDFGKDNGKNANYKYKKSSKRNQCIRDYSKPKTACKKKNYTRNEDTQRCRKDCAEGYNRNPKGRCRKDCAEGYERNDNSGRCRMTAAKRTALKDALKEQRQKERKAKKVLKTKEKAEAKLTKAADKAAEATDKAEENVQTQENITNELVKSLEAASDTSNTPKKSNTPKNATDNKSTGATTRSKTGGVKTRAQKQNHKNKK